MIILKQEKCMLLAQPHFYNTNSHTNSYCLLCRPQNFYPAHPLTLFLCLKSEFVYTIKPTQKIACGVNHNKRTIRLVDSFHQCKQIWIASQLKYNISSGLCYVSFTSNLISYWNTIQILTFRHRLIFQLFNYYYVT